MLKAPITPNSRNHISMNTPNDLPILSVPKRCTKKMMVMMPSVMGMTGRWGLILSSPSMAVVTVMAGVMIPSASKVLAPMMANK